MAGREAALEIFCVNSELFQGLIETEVSVSVSGEFYLWCNTGHKPAHFVLLWTRLGKYKQRCMLPAQGIAQGDAVLEPRHGEHLALAVREGQSRAGCLGGILFCGAMRAAHQHSFPFWRSGAVTPREAKEATFWPAFCLSYLAGASQIQLAVSRRLCSQGWIPQSAQCTSPPASTLSSPRSQGTLDLPGSTS